jgi:hypothetical protein
VWEVSRAVCVVDLSRITLLDVLRLLKDLLGWIATLARAVEAIGFIVSMAKLLNSCVVSYCRDLVVVFYGEGAAKLPEWFVPLVLPPTLLVDCRAAKSVVAYAKNLCEDLVKRLEYEDPFEAGVLRYDVEGLEVIRVRELYHPKKLIKVFKSFILMKYLRNFTIDGVNVYDVMVVNWRRLEERAAWGVLARA